MAESWQDATSQQVKLIAGRLNELLSTGLDLLHSELGVDLGLKPVLIPPWVILLAACVGLVLMVALWASACRGLFKKRPTITTVDESIETTKPAVTKQVVRTEEQKKKKRKTTEKKSQSNGRAAVAELPEEVVEDIQVKTEKVPEVKKTKKKPKPVVKEVKAVTTAGKEPEEDTWETKVSNKEKREQRRKDKPTSDGSGSPGGVEPSAPAPTVQPRTTVSASAVQKKKKGESSRTKAEKVDVVAPQVNSSEAVVETGSLSDLAVKSLSYTTGPNEEHLAATQTTSENKNNDTSLWGLETEGSWTVIDAEPKTPDLNLASFTELGVVTAAVEPQPMSDLPWPSQPQVEDEWSGLNGGSADPSSDWNAPAEVWGNYEEPLVETPPAPEEEQFTEAVKGSDEEKEKADSATDGSGTSKKKKKKKKKQDAVVEQESEEPEGEVVAENEAMVQKQPIQETAPTVQTVKAAVERPPALVQDNISQKALTQVPETPVETETSAKQNSLPSLTQKKPEESQPLKQVKKKKARRET